MVSCMDWSIQTLVESIWIEPGGWRENVQRLYFPICKGLPDDDNMVISDEMV